MAPCVFLRFVIICFFSSFIFSKAAIALSASDLIFPVEMSAKEVGLFSITNNSPSTHTAVWYGNDSNAADINLNYVFDSNNKKTSSYDRDAGKNVLAIADGEIVNTGATATSYGWVLIKHTTPITIDNVVYSEWSSGYMHMKNIKTSGVVKKGDVIGTVSDVGAGNSHLHFAIYSGAKYQKGYLTSIPVASLLEDLQKNVSSSSTEKNGALQLFNCLQDIYPTIFYPRNSSIEEWVQRDGSTAYGRVHSTSTKYYPVLQAVWNGDYYLSLNGQWYIFGPYRSVIDEYCTVSVTTTY